MINIKKSGFGILMAMMVAVTLVGCKSDEEDLFNEYFDIADEVNVVWGEEVEAFSLKKGDDALIIPAAIGNMDFDAEDTNIVDFVNGELTAVGVGSTFVNLYNSNGDLIRQIPVHVGLPFELYPAADNKIDLDYGGTIDLITDLNDFSSYNISRVCSFESSDKDVVKVTNQGVVSACGKGTADVTVTAVSTKDVIATYTINVSPTLILNLTSGDVVNLKDYLNIGNYSSLKSSDSDVAGINYYGNIVTAKKAGSAILSNSDYSIEVNVSEGSLKELFNVNALPASNKMYVYPDDVISNMSDYSLVSSGTEEYNGTTYYTLAYEPFDKATSIKYYFYNGAFIQTFKFAIITTSYSSEDVLAWLVNNMYRGTSGYISGEFESFEYDSYGRIKIKPLNGSWSSLKVE